MLDLFRISAILVSVMREKFIPKKEEVLRKAWMKEWESMPKTDSDWPSWEAFKRMKQSTKFIPRKKG